MYWRFRRKSEADIWKLSSTVNFCMQYAEPSTILNFLENLCLYPNDYNSRRFSTKDLLHKGGTEYGTQFDCESLPLGQ